MGVKLKVDTDEYNMTILHLLPIKLIIMLVDDLVEV